MKRLLATTLVAALLGAVWGCKRCNCYNGGTCTDGKCECTSPYTGDKCLNLERERHLGRWQIVYRGFLTDNIFSAPEKYRIDRTTVVSAYEDAANNRFVIPKFLGEENQTLTITVYQDRLTPGKATYFITTDDGKKHNVEISTFSQTRTGSQVIFDLSYGSLATGNTLREFEMIMTKQ